MLEPNLNTKTIREIILCCDTIGLNASETIEIINKIIEQRSLPDYIDKDARKVTEARYYKHREAMNKQLGYQTRGSIYEKPTSLLLQRLDMGTIEAVSSAVYSHITKESLDRITKELVSKIKMTRTNRIR